MKNDYKTIKNNRRTHQKNIQIEGKYSRSSLWTFIY